VALIDDVKTYLGITWSDPHTDSNVTGILARAQSKICDYAGAQLNFNTESSEKQLLLDLCRYIYNNASEDFEDNYKHELVMLRAEHAVEVTDDETGEDVESEDDSGTG
jgi:hypothetical protein